VGALAVLALFGAACDGGDTTSASTTTSRPPLEISEDAACTLVTTADAEAVFGDAATPSAAEQPEGVVSQCIYESAVPGGGQFLQFRIFDGVGYYSEKVVEGATPLEDLGDRAYVDAQGPEGIVDLQFTDDGSVYALAYSNSSGDAAAKAPLVETLARELASEG